LKYKSISLVIYFSLIFIVSNGLADILLQQDFNSSWSTQSPPAGWTIFFTLPVGNSDWHRNEAETPWSDNLTGYACLYYNPQETGEDILTSPAVNCSLYTHVNVRCSTYFIPGDGYYVAKLQGTTDNGLNWIEVYNYFGPNLGPTLQVIPCTWADTKSSVKFRWYFSGNTSQLYHWSIDNVAIRADPAIFDVGVTQIFAPSGTIDSGTVVTPKVRVKNFGNISASCPVTLKIGGFYNDMQYVNLSPGESTLVGFVDWTATQVGTNTVKCSTALANDVSPSNNAKTDSVKVRVIDVGVTQIVVPKDTIDSIGIIKPVAKVRNYGSAAATFSVTFKIGSVYFQSRNKTLAAQIEDTVNFPGWSSMPGNYITRCSTYLTGDIRRNNDTLGGTVKIRTIDVGATQIIAPSGDVDSTGQTITPVAGVVNYGSEVVTFNVTLKIGTFYSQTRAKTLSPGGQDTVNFPGWIPRRGTFATRCSTYLANDHNHANDAISGSVTVHIRDIGVTQIVTPTGTIDSSGLITPQVLVKNYGTYTQPFNITMKIGAAYSQTRSKSVAPTLEDTVNFSDWGTIRGTYPTRCSLYLAGDINPYNDTIAGSVTVRVKDVGVVGINAPTGIIDSGTTITPVARVSNFGTAIVLFPVTYEIGSWSETRNKVLTIGQTDTVNFSPWTAQTPGDYQAEFYTSLVGDLVPANDSLFDSIFVVVRDVGVTRIVAPANLVPMDTIIPQAWIKNFGTIASGPFEVRFDISPSYTNIQSVPNLNAQESLLVSFSPWAESCGSYIKKCSTRMAGDRNPANDRWSGTVIVSLTGQPPDSWVELAKPIPGLKPVKDGGCLTVLQETLLFIAKGNKTLDFYCYNTSSNEDSWVKKADVPLGIGPKFKMVKKGGKMVGDGERYIYLVKGNNTFEFYRYDLDQDSWKSMPDVPFGLGKKIKDGAAMAYCKKGDVPFIYLLKGTKTVEFYRFNVLWDSWERMPNAPPGKKIGFKSGSSLTYDSENQILYLLKDATNEMFSYDIMRDTWLTKKIAGMPLIHRLIGKSKKVKAGGTLCLLSPNIIYALKGGNTNEFWLFEPLTGDSGRWSGLTSLPDIGADTKKKRVKDGGDLVTLSYHNQAALIALKGNKTVKVWKWAADSMVVFTPNKEIAANGVSVAEHYALPQFQIKPNPINDNAFIEFNLPKLSNVSVNLYNIIGQNIYQLKTAKQNGPITLKTKNIPAGVYLLKLEADKFRVTRKIIISH
jgi:hypothetical protein